MFSGPCCCNVRIWDQATLYEFLLTCSLWCIFKKKVTSLILKSPWHSSWYCDMLSLFYLNSWPVSSCSDVLPSTELDKDDALPQATNSNPLEEKQPQETSTVMVHAYTHTHTQTRLWLITYTRKHINTSRDGCLPSSMRLHWFWRLFTASCHRGHMADMWKSAVM